MYQIVVDKGFTGWRKAARQLLAADIPPESISWQADRQSLELFGDNDLPTGNKVVNVPKAFLALAWQVSCHSDPQRWSLLYRALWRLTHGERELLQRFTDADTSQLQNMAKAVRRCAHKMEAFVRFREIIAPDGEPWFIAWFEPDHYTLEYKADFFKKRFYSMRFSILTPYRSMHWNGAELSYSKGAFKEDAPTADKLEDYWLTYYANIFNPARLKVQAMQSEMPQKYWKNLPEAALIAPLIADAKNRTAAMIEADETPAREVQAPSALAVINPAAAAAASSRVESLNAQLQHCEGCGIHKNATQAVAGCGPINARWAIVGEQPGDEEDIRGEVFVGPAGQLLNSALQNAGLAREQAYITNAVKHFKWQPQGKKRIHARATAREQSACAPWLRRELQLVQPEKILLLGATATRAILGDGLAIEAARGEWFNTGIGAATFQAMVLPHPSWLLRLPAAQYEAEFQRYVLELREFSSALNG